MRKTLVLGIGNTLLTDEGLGIHLLNYLQQRHSDLANVTWLDGGTLSFTLAPQIEDHDSLIVLDAAQLNSPPGTIRLLENEAMDRFIGQGKRSVHEVGLIDLMSIAHMQGHLPKRRALLGIQPAEFGWGDLPSGIIAQILPEAALKVVDLLHTWSDSAE